MELQLKRTEEVKPKSDDLYKDFPQDTLNVSLREREQRVKAR